jgi:hypothetical protein
MFDALTAVHAAAKAAFASRQTALTSGAAAEAYVPPTEMTDAGVPKLLKDISDRMQAVLPNKSSFETTRTYEESALAMGLARDHLLASENRLQRFAFHGDFLANGLYEASDKTDSDGFLLGNIKKVGM